MNRLFVLASVLSLTSVQAFADGCKKADIKAAVEHVCSLVSASGKKAIPEIQKYRYECGGPNYAWVQVQGSVVMVMHPIKLNLNGKSVADHKDEKGKKLFSEFDKAATANKDGDWVDYLWTKTGAENATPKTSFVKVCPSGPDMGSEKWIAGSGAWVDTLK